MLRWYELSFAPTFKMKTICYEKQCIGDNTDIIQLKESLVLLRNKTVTLLNAMKHFALKYANMPTLGYTHCQPAQLTTIGMLLCTSIVLLAVFSVSVIV